MLATNQMPTNNWHEQIRNQTFTWTAFQFTLPAMEHYLGVARKEGLTDEEIGVVQSIVMSISACKVRSQLQEVQERIMIRE